MSHIGVCHALSKKDLRSWLKGSLSWSKSECETVRPCILCLATVSHLSQESLMLWLEANVSVYHQRIMIQNLLEHCWTEGLSFWKAIRPQSFFMWCFRPAALWHLVFFDSTQKKLSASRHHLQTQWKRHWSISQSLSGILYLFWSFLLETNQTRKG